MPDNSGVKAHILELKNANMPVWPEEGFGEEWESIVFEIEKYFRKCNGKPDLISVKIESMYATYPQLKKLLADPVQGGNEQEELLYPELPPSFDYLKELAPQACTWLDDCVAFLRKWSPRGYEGYYEAVAISILSTVAARRVSINFSGPEYTPLFIALVGPTTFFKKSTTAKHFAGILEAAGLDWLLGADVTTPQKLLSNMAGKTLPANYGEMTEEEQIREQKRIAMAGQIGWYYDEFGQHLDQMVKENGIMADFCGLLRLLDDGKKKHRYDTHRRGKEIIYNPSLSLLAALTPSDIKPHAQKGNKFWKDGLFARFAFVCVPRNAKIKRDRALKEELVYPAHLLTPLNRWHYWLGEPEVLISTEKNDNGDITKYKMDIIKELPDRRVLFPDDVENAFYEYEGALMDMCQSLDGKPGLIPESIHGNYGRLPKLALRIAMLLASFDNQGHEEQPRIEMRHWARAWQFAESRRKDLHELYAQVNVPEDNASLEMEDEIIRHMTRLSEKGQEWTTANGLRGYMKGKSREEIEDKLRALEKQKVLEMQKTTHSIKYKIAEESDE